MIEVNEDASLMKSASGGKMTYDGSTVIIPNGDLIAQHIVNWTHENKSRRIEVLVE